jgi:D-ribulokinase
MSYYLGLDFGTSGARSIAIDQSGAIVHQARAAYPGDRLADPESWRSALIELLSQLPEFVAKQLTRIAIDGTSGTMLLADRQGNPIGDVLLYNDDRGAGWVDRLRPLVPVDHGVLSSTSTLVKLLWSLDSLPLDSEPVYLLHQVDWIASLLHGLLGRSDYHNVLKLGYDVDRLCYPDWLLNLDVTTQSIAPLLPKVHSPGEPVGMVLETIATRFKIIPTCQICAGTTDSIAAFLAAGATEIGDAVTSLGSTLVLKLLSAVRLDDAAAGLYSHRLGDRWLVGGASNSGGAVLRHYFDDRQLATLTDQLMIKDLTTPSPYDYYPLLKPGERFPINDPNWSPRLTPRPENPAEFLYGLLDGMARIEALGYGLLSGATPLGRVYTAGGGAQNPVWTRLRQQRLGVEVGRAIQVEAAYGAAILARDDLRVSASVPTRPQSTPKA